MATRDSETAEAWRAWGEQLAEARIEQGWSKRRAAAEIGVSEGAWRQYEAGGRIHYDTWVIPSPRQATLRTIERILGVHIDLLTGDVWRTDPEPQAQPAAASGDPSHLSEIMGDLTEAVRDLRDEVRRLREERGETGDVGSVEGPGK